MSAPESPAARRFHAIVKIAMVVIAIPVVLIGIFLAFVLYTNWSAEREAKTFCDAIEAGSDISKAILRFEMESGYTKKVGGKVSGRHFGYPDGGLAKDGHTFMFPGFVFDKAYCDVSLADDGKVTSKNSYFLAD